MSCTYTTEGSFILLALIRKLRALEQDVDVVELMRRVQEDMHNTYNGDSRQTPQVSVFPHRPTFFCARQVPRSLIKWHKAYSRI